MLDAEQVASLNDSLTHRLNSKRNLPHKQSILMCEFRDMMIQGQQEPNLLVQDLPWRRALGPDRDDPGAGLQDVWSNPGIVLAICMYIEHDYLSNNRLCQQAVTKEGKTVWTKGSVEVVSFRTQEHSLLRLSGLGGSRPRPRPRDTSTSSLNRCNNTCLYCITFCPETSIFILCGLFLQVGLNSS